MNAFIAGFYIFALVAIFILGFLAINLTTDIASIRNTMDYYSSLYRRTNDKEYLISYNKNRLACVIKVLEFCITSLFIFMLFGLSIYLTKYI